jgi:hypothetical protein
MTDNQLYRVQLNDPWVREQVRQTHHRRKQIDKRKRLARQAKANKAAGSRFERAVRLAFERRGFTASRVCETHGRTRGWDIYVEELPEAVVQCKATKTKAALLNGLNEARKHNPGAKLWVCFHSYRPKGGRVTIRVAYTSSTTRAPSTTDPDGFFHVLRKAAGGYPDG